MPEIVLKLPTLHADQVQAYWAYKRFPRFVLRAGRRWGKTALLATIASDCALKGGYVGWFVPEHKYAAEAFFDISNIVAPVSSISNSTQGLIRLRTGGRFDFWTLSDNPRAGASRSYDLIVSDEHAFNKNAVKATWEKAMEPTLFDRSGRAIFASNTNGVDPDNHFYQLNAKVEDPEQPKYGEYHAPTAANPLLPRRETGESEEDHARRRVEAIEELRREKPPLVFLQEHEAAWVDWSGVAFFDLQKLLELGQPVPWPTHCDAVYATIDTATKTGTANDATAVCYWARTFAGFGPHQLVLLDWDIQQIEGSLLEGWLPLVFGNLERMATTCRARGGSQGAMIEDKNSGMVLLQQAARRGWPARAIDSKLTSMGKSERAIAASPHVHQGLVKFSDAAYNKVVTFKNDTRNHLVSQVLGFRIGDEDRKKADDGTDAFTYGVVVAFGTAGGA